MKSIITLILLLANINFAQTDWKKWEKAEIDYSINKNSIVISQIDNENKTGLSLLKDGYSFFISDVDGDNCPFYPTCSSFFVSSVSETNILQGTLMFADRFTRDSNLFKAHNHYPIYKSGKLFDPIENHLLLDSTIISSIKSQVK